MVDNAIFKDYLTQIEQACKAGNATEHTHRPALKDLLEASQPGITATNEPKRIKCGAPDYIITRKDIPLGFVEAKDTGVSLLRQRPAGSVEIVHRKVLHWCC